jgi:hypothetical protein
MLGLAVSSVSASDQDSHLGELAERQLRVLYSWVVAVPWLTKETRKQLTENKAIGKRE